MPEIASNPLFLILEKINSGVHPSMPKPSSPFAHFAKTNQRELAQVIARRWNENQNSEVNDSNNGICTPQDRPILPPDEFCTRISMEEFGTLSEADRNRIRDAVDREYLGALENYNEAIRRIYPIMNINDRSVDAVTDFLQPILSGLEAMTGITFNAWGGGLIQGGLGLLNISSRANSCDEPAEHLMIFPKSQTNNFEQAALNWMHNVHSNFIRARLLIPYDWRTRTKVNRFHVLLDDSRCTALELAEFECSRLPKNFATPQSAHVPRDSEDLVNGVEDPPLEPPQPFLAPTNVVGPGDPADFADGGKDSRLEPCQPALAPTNFIGPADPDHFANRAEDPPPPSESPQSAASALTTAIALEDPEDLASGGEDSTPEPISPGAIKTVNTPLSTKRRISNGEADGDDSDENQQNSKKMRFNTESPHLTSQRNVSVRVSRWNAATSNPSAQVMPVVMMGRESVPPISTLSQTVTPRRHSFPRTTQLPPKKPAGTAKTGQKRNSLPSSASTKPQGAPAGSAETLASLIKKLPTTDKGFMQGLGSIMKVELGPAYRQLLICLVRLEVTTGGKAKEKFLNRTFRPKEIKEWIHQGRGRNNRILVINNVSEFAEQWWTWWTILQPKWRTKDKNGRPLAVIRDADEDWRCLHVPGGNGLICAVAGLYWWGRKLKEVKVNTEASKENWNKAVNDCLWVLQRIVSSFDKKVMDSSSGDAVDNDDVGDEAMDDEDPQSEGDELDSSDED